MVVVETDADANRQCPASPMLNTRHRVNTSGWPVAITSVSARYRHCCPSPVVQVTACNLGSGRMNGLEPHPQLRRVSSDRSRHRRPSPVDQVPARNLGSGRMSGPESLRQLRRVSSARWYAHLSSVGKSPSEHRRSATTRTRLRRLRLPESCETLLMPNASLIPHRTGPNPALKLTVNGMPRWPSGAGPSAHFAPAVPRVTPLPAA